MLIYIASNQTVKLQTIVIFVIFFSFSYSMKGNTTCLLEDI